jgi:hypothetical protein
MWRTSEGERVLQGAEWELFRQGLSTLWDDIEESFNDPDFSETGVEAFDQLQPHQKLAMLALVGRALHDPSMLPIELTATTEGTAAAVFADILHRLAMEIDFQDDPEMGEHATFWRDLVLAAAQEMEADWEEPLPDRRCADASEWDFLIECLSGRIFWDADYEMGQHFLDADPHKREALTRLLGIDGDYFIAVAPDPTDKQLEHIRGQLRLLTGRSEPKRDSPG